MVLAHTSLCFAAAAGTVTEIRGDVTVKRPGSEKPVALSKDDGFFAGDVIKTGKGAAVQLAFPDGTFMNIAEGGAVRVNQYTYDETTKRRSAHIRVLAGLARIVVMPQESLESVLHAETDSARITAGMSADFVVNVTSVGTEVAVLDKTATVANVASYIVGTMQLRINEKVVVTVKAPPSKASILTSEERKSFIKGTRIY